MGLTFQGRVAGSGFGTPPGEPAGRDSGGGFGEPPVGPIGCDPGSGLITPYVYPPINVPIWLFTVTTTSTVPAACAPVVQVSVVLFAICTLVQATPPRLTIAHAA